MYSTGESFFFSGKWKQTTTVFTNVGLEWVTRGLECKMKWWLMVVGGGYECSLVLYQGVHCVWKTWPWCAYLFNYLYYLCDHDGTTIFFPPLQPHSPWPPPMPNIMSIRSPPFLRCLFPLPSHLPLLPHTYHMSPDNGFGWGKCYASLDITPIFIYEQW